MHILVKTRYNLILLLYITIIFALTFLVIYIVLVGAMSSYFATAVLVWSVLSLAALFFPTHIIFSKQVADKIGTGLGYISICIILLIIPIMYPLSNKLGAVLIGILLVIFILTNILDIFMSAKTHKCKIIDYWERGQGTGKVYVWVLYIKTPSRTYKPKISEDLKRKIITINKGSIVSIT